MLVHHVVIVALVSKEWITAGGSYSPVVFPEHFLGSLKSFCSLKYGFFDIFGGWSSDSYEGTLFFFLRAKRTNLGPKWTQTSEWGLLRYIYASFLDFWALLSLNKVEMDFLRHFHVQNCQMLQKLSFFTLNLHKMCVSGRIWAELKARNDENTSKYVSRRLSGWSKSILKPKVV